jgi:tetratricopeptide (TPR) repeat protein
MAVKKEHAGAMYNLALLYQAEMKDLKRAEKYYLMAVEKEHAKAMYNLAWLYFEMKKDKEKALKLAEAAYTSEKDIYNAHTLCTILLWNNEIQRAIEISNHFLETEDSLEEFPDDVVLFLMLLMAKKQYHLALKIFHDNPYHLKDRFKPVYYTLMHFLKDEFPNEHKKMGGELEETVKEIIEKIKQMENDYD